MGEFLKLMVSTEKDDVGSYSHFTKNMDSSETEHVHSIAKYPNPNLLNENRSLKVQKIFDKKGNRFFIYYKNFI